MTPEQEAAHDALLKELQSHIQLGGVEPPSASAAAAGAMRDDPSPSGEGFEASPYPGPAPATPRPESKAAPAFDTSQPVAFRPPAPKKTDDELAGARETDKRSRAWGRLGQAVTSFTERPSAFLSRMTGAGSGGDVRPQHNAMWDEQAANGDNAVGDLMAQRKSDDAMATKQASAADMAQKKDPNSQTARTYRSVLLKFAPDLGPQLEGATPEQMERIAPWLEKYAAENADIIQAKAAAEAKAAHDAEAKAIHEKERGEDLKHRELTHADSQANADATRSLAGASLSLRKSEAERAESDKAQAGAQHLGDKAGEAQAAAKALDDIDAVIAKDPNNIPGVGKWKSLVPDFAAGAVLSDEGQRVRNNARDVLGILLHQRSGAAVSPAELARYEQMYGLNGDDQQFKDGIARMRRDFAAQLAATQAGVSPAAKQKYKQGGGLAAEDIAPKATGGRVHVVDESGSDITLPAEQVDDYLKDFPKARRAGG